MTSGRQTGYLCCSLQEAAPFPNQDISFRSLESSDIRMLEMAVFSLDEAEPNLDELPSFLLPTVCWLANGEIAKYSEYDAKRKTKRTRLSTAFPNQTEATRRFVCWMNSHPFWSCRQEFFGDAGLCSADFFTQRELQELPIYREALRHVGGRHFLYTCFRIADVDIQVGVTRLGQTEFSDRDREMIAAFRPHLRRIYGQARERTLRTMSVHRRVELAFPALTPRQAEILGWLAEGKSNEVIARLCGISIEAVKWHLKAIYRKLGVEDRLAAAIAALRAEPVYIPSRNARRTL